jgi:predicted NBD/HSP70 family sugar kinase
MIRFFSDIQDLKITEKLLYKIIHQYGPITKNEAFNHVGSSLATVSRIIDSLTKKGLIQIENKDVAGGRTPSKYVVTPDACYSFGAYISHEMYGIGLCDIAGNILEKTETLLEKTTTPTEVAEFFAQFIQTTISKYSIAKEKIPGIGAAVAGPILKRKGMMYHPQYLISNGWDIVPIKDLIEMKTGYSVWIDTLTEILLLSELVYGRHKGSSNASYLWIDKGVGAAFYSNGTFGMRNQDMSSSVGHMVIDFASNRPCVCGRSGCLETYVLVDVLLSGIRAIKPEIEIPAKQVEYTPEQLWGFRPELRLVERYQYSQEPKLQQFFQEISEAFTVATLNFVHLTRPEILFWGGRMAEQLPSVFEPALERIQTEYARRFEQELHCIQSHVSGDMLIAGAGFLVFDNYIQYFG